MNDPLLQIPFQTILAGALLLGVLFTLWSMFGLRDAYRAIGHGWISLDIPYTDEPSERNGSQ
jgi:hypothetical protein